MGEKTKVMSSSRQPSPIKIRISQKQLESVEYFKYLGSMITNNAKCTHEIKSRISMAKQHSTRRLFCSRLDLNLRKKLVNCYIWSIALYGAEMRCWRRMDISWADHVRNKEALPRVKEERNILSTIKRRKPNWIGHILHRHCRIKHMTEGKLEGRIE
jgi:hypothetical protein